MSSIAENIARTRGRIAECARQAGRQPSDVTLLAVTKGAAPERIREAFDAGVSDFGENYVQESREKVGLLGPDARWHFIGHLQTNKAKYIPGVFHMLHSLDSADLADQLERRAREKEIVLKVLIEVKLDPAATKNGIEPANLPALVERVSQCPHLALLGLMGMAPLVESQDSARPYFGRLRGLLEALPPESRSVLSMGMTADFEAAILEGATIVRVGSAIFGPRIMR